jgi:hypothetical protein
MKDSTNVIANGDVFPWNVLFPDLIWMLFWIFILLVCRNFIKETIVTLINRLKHGAGIKIGALELEGLKVIAGDEIQNRHFKTTDDNSGLRYNERAAFYEEQRGAMLVHKIFKSQKSDQLYDILIYLVPKKDCNSHSGSKC